MLTTPTWELSTEPTAEGQASASVSAHRRVTRPRGPSGRMALRLRLEQPLLESRVRIEVLVLFVVLYEYALLCEPRLSCLVEVVVERTPYVYCPWLDSVVDEANTTSSALQHAPAVCSSSRPGTLQYSTVQVV